MTRNRRVPRLRAGDGSRLSRWTQSGIPASAPRCSSSARRPRRSRPTRSRRRSASIATWRGRGSSGCWRSGLVLDVVRAALGPNRPGRRRPTKVYEPAPELAAIEFPGAAHRRARGRARSTTSTPPSGTRRSPAPARASRARSPTAAALRGSTALPAAAEAVCAAMRRLGFQATVDRGRRRPRPSSARRRARSARSSQASAGRGRARPRALVGPARTRAARRRVGNYHLRDARVPRPGRLVRGAPPARGRSAQAAVEPGSRAAYSRRSNQCVARSASATTGSV